jgi:hypothetical protein
MSKYEQHLAFSVYYDLSKPNIWLVKEKFLEFWNVLVKYLFG